MRPGTSYAYSLFTRRGGRWLGPLTARLQTPARSGGAQASFVAAPATVFVAQRSIESVAPAAGGISVVLDGTAARPAVGAAMVLPASTALSGGYIGVVTGLTPDGGVQLRPGGIGDALDQYDLSVPAFTSDAQALPLDRVRATLAGRSTRIRPMTVTQGAGLLHRTSAQSKTSPFTCSGLDNTDPKTGKPKPGAKDGAPEVKLAMQVSDHFAMGGDFELTGDMDKLTADIDVQLFVEGEAVMNAELSGKATCQVALPAIEETVPVGPVPIALSVQPVASATISGAVRFKGAGFTFRSGFTTKQHLALTPKGLSVNGTTRPISELKQLTPSVSARADLELRLGADAKIGPGVTSEFGGMSAGLFSDIDLVKATLGVAGSSTPDGPAACVQFGARLKAVSGVYARAFLRLGPFSAEASATADIATLDVPFGSTISSPAGCKLDEVYQPTTTIVSDPAFGSPSSGSGSSGGGGGGGGGGGWPSDTASSPPFGPDTRSIGDGATVALPADAGDQVAWRTLSGHVTDDTTLGADVAHSGWMLDNVTVDPGATLTIAAGTRLRFFDRHEWWGTLIPTVHVNGSLVVQGTATDPVLLASQNDTAVGGTTGRENPYFDRNGIGANYHAFEGGPGSTIRIVHAFARNANTFVSGSADVDIRASGFQDGTRLAGGATLTLEQLQVQGLTVEAFGDSNIEDAALAGSSIRIQKGRLQDVALTAGSSIAVIGPDVTFDDAAVSADSLPLKAEGVALAGDWSGITSPDGSPWIDARPGTVTDDRTWTNQLPVVISDYLRVSAGATLTFRPGSVYKFPAVSDIYGGAVAPLIVSGRLVALGGGTPTVFTARSDTTTGPVEALGPRSQGWGGIRVASGGSVDLTDTDVRGRIAVDAGGGVALHGASGSTGASDHSVHVSAGGTASVTSATLTATSLDGDGRITTTDSTLMDSSVTVTDPLSSIDRVSVRGAASALGAAARAVNAYGTVRFTDGAEDEIHVTPDSNALGGDQHWTTKVPISVDYVVPVASNGTLTVDPGVTLRLGPCYWGSGRRNSCFRLSGSAALRLLGTAADPVRIVQQQHLSAWDPTLPLDWFGIEANDTSTVELRHVRATGAEEILRSADDAAVTIDDLQHEQDVSGAVLFRSGSRTAPIVSNSPGIG